MIIVIIIANTSSPNGDPYRWNSTFDSNGTDEIILDAKIGIAPNRAGVGVDKTGQAKKKW